MIFGVKVITKGPKIARGAEIYISRSTPNMAMIVYSKSKSHNYMSGMSLELRMHMATMYGVFKAPHNDDDHGNDDKEGND